MPESPADKLVVCYSRVSSVSQNLDRQSEGFSAKQKFDRTYADKVSGIVPFAERPSGARLLDDCRKGLIGEVHFWELSRLGRDTLDILQTVRFFEEHQVQVRVLKEGITLLDANGKVSATATIIVAVLSALASIERQNIKERQLEGIALAKLKGRYVGRKHGTTESADKFLAKPKSKEIAKLLDADYPVAHIAKVLEVSTTTVVKVNKLRKAAKATA